MGVFRRPDSKYWWLWLEGAPNGRRKRRTHIRIGVTKSQQMDSRRAAEEIYHREMLKLGKGAHGVPVAPDPIAFETFATWYDTHTVRKGVEREREILRRLRADFGDRLLTEITKPLVIEWRARRLTTPTVVAHFGGRTGKHRVFPPPAARTVNREVDVLQQVLQSAVVAGHLLASPIYGLRDLPIVKPIRRIMSGAEELAILAELAPDDRAIFLVGLDTLTRLGEILDLRRADDHGATLDIRDPKNGQAHTVPISRRLRAALDAVPIEATAPEWYFPRRRGASTDRDRRRAFTHALARACRRARVPYGRRVGGITFHWATRRTGATRMIRQGGDKVIGVVQQIGGWKDPRVLIGIYQETTIDEMRAAVESIAPLTTAAPPRPEGGE